MQTIEQDIIAVFADRLRRKSMSLRQAERLLGISDTYISRVISQRVQPSQSFLHKVLDFIVTQ